MADLGRVFGAVLALGVVIIPMVLCLNRTGPSILQMLGSWLISICLILAASVAIRKQPK